MEYNHYSQAHKLVQITNPVLTEDMMSSAQPQEIIIPATQHYRIMITVQ